MNQDNYANGRNAEQHTTDAWKRGKNVVSLQCG